MTHALLDPQLRERRVHDAAAWALGEIATALRDERRTSALDELRQAVAEGEVDDRTGAIKEEIGDVLFTAANLARKLEQDPEAALASSNVKFRERFGRMEAKLAADERSIIGAAREELEDLWQTVKRQQRSRAPKPPD